MTTKFLNLDLDVMLGGNSPSDYIIPSQKAIKTYVDNSKQTVEVSSDTNGNIILSTTGFVISDDNNGNVILN